MQIKASLAQLPLIWISEMPQMSHPHSTQEKVCHKESQTGKKQWSELIMVKMYYFAIFKNKTCEHMSRVSSETLEGDHAKWRALKGKLLWLLGKSTSEFPFHLISFLSVSFLLVWSSHDMGTARSKFFVQ